MKKKEKKKKTSKISKIFSFYFLFVFCIKTSNTHEKIYKCLEKRKHKHI